MAATVLVVGDARKLRELVRSYLERAGLSVLSAGAAFRGGVLMERPGQAAA